MKTLVAFFKKEMMEQIRSGKILILSLIFVFCGIMNPAIAKLTPWLLEVVGESLAQSGVIITDVSVTAMDSWVQFFKNMPIVLIVFVLLESNIFTKEYQDGTLILSLTKGLERYKVVVAKTVVLVFVWTVLFWLCFAITFGYNAYFWDNSIVQNLGFSVACWWLFGLFAISLMVLFSTLSKSNTGVLVGAGGIVLLSWLVGLVAKLKKYLPTFLADGNSLIYGIAEVQTYVTSLIITAVLIAVCFATSFVLFDKKSL